LPTLRSRQLDREHTDYNGGLVLPVAIPQRVRVAVAPRADARVRLVTTAAAIAPAESACEYRLGAEVRRGHWSDYVQGCTTQLRAAGHHLRGFDAVLSSTVPVGAGLASSAALEVAILRALRSTFELACDDVALALLAHRAECDFVGARVGVMDQMAASLADQSSALFLDARSLAWERIPLPADAELAVIDSGITHRHASGGYNARRAECERAASLLGVASLRELDADAGARAEALPAPLDRRVRHVVGENARVRATVAALRDGNVTEVGRLLAAGHASLRDDFEVSIPEIDTLVELASADPDVLGARMTGGGFGGAVVMLGRRGRMAAAAARIAAAYARHAVGGRVLVAGSAAGDGPVT
jgi:galactokinase